MWTVLVACTFALVVGAAAHTHRSRDASLVDRSITNNPASFAQKTYDYVVIGGGTAGLTVAARLSEDGKYTVGVLEAGGSGQDVDIVDIPGDYGADIASVYDWNYTTVPDESTGVPSIFWPRGKVLGGTSALHFMVWNRASQAEYDAWELLGNPGWNWTTMYKYMRKAEEFIPPSSTLAAELNISPNPADYGSSGPIQVTFDRWVDDLVKNWIPALLSLGLQKNDNVLAGNNIGASLQPSSVNPVNQTRSYSASAYLFPNIARPNLEILTNALVTKINFAPQEVLGNLSATSVSFMVDGQSYTVQVGKEVIVSGGTVNTPQILELSGIGNATILAMAGIEQLVDLPSVGENLQDHVGTSQVFELKPGHITQDTIRNNATFAQEQLTAYEAGQLSIFDLAPPTISYVPLSTVLSAGALVDLIAEATRYVANSDTPYQETLAAQLVYLADNDVAQIELLGGDQYSGSGSPDPNSTYVTFLAHGQQLFSRGSVHITSSSATTYPRIQPNYLSAPVDLQIVAAAAEFARDKLAAIPQYANYIARQVVPAPGTNLTDWAPGALIAEYHPIGTASMLPRDKGGVVNNQLVVYGTANVRVVDASIIPLHVSAHPQNTVFGIAEYASDLILGNVYLERDIIDWAAGTQDHLQIHYHT